MLNSDHACEILLVCTKLTWLFFALNFNDFQHFVHFNNFHSIGVLPSEQNLMGKKKTDSGTPSKGGDEPDSGSADDQVATACSVTHDLRSDKINKDVILVGLRPLTVQLYPTTSACICEIQLSNYLITIVVLHCS